MSVGYKTSEEERRMKRQRKDKWEVCGEFGGTFTNLKDAKKCAREASTTPEHDYASEIWLIEEYVNYIDYEHGKLVRDGWTKKR